MQIELGEASFDHDAAYSDCKDLAKRTISGKILKNRSYEIGRNCRYYEYQRELSTSIRFVIRKQN